MKIELELSNSLQNNKKVHTLNSLQVQKKIKKKLL